MTLCVGAKVLLHVRSYNLIIRITATSYDKRFSFFFLYPLFSEENEKQEDHSGPVSLP